MSASPGRFAAHELEAFGALVRRAGSCFESEIRGTSMAPTIPDGSRIRIRPLVPDAYREGDVVACVLGDSLFAHRIVHSDPAGALVLTRGDGWLLCDSPTRRERILGAVSEYFKDGSWQAPGGPPRLAGWRAGVARASLWSVRAALPLHPQVARRVAGCMLALGALVKSRRKGDGRDPGRVG